MISPSLATKEEFTWHHHQELGRMELIPDWIHRKVGHSGGNSRWPREKGGDK